MNKLFLKTFGLNLIFVIILLILNTVLIESVSLISIENFVILVTGIIISLIVSTVLCSKPYRQVSEKKEKKQNLRDRLIEYIDEIEKMNIDTPTLETAYISSIKLFESIITDKETNTIIERHFRSIVESEISRASRYELKFGLLLLNIFKPELVSKTINLSEVIREMSTVSKKLLRAVDIIGRYKNGLIYLLPQTDLKGTIRAGERILNTIKQLKLTGKDNKPVEVNVSIGVSAFPDQGRNYEALLKSAEKNVQQADLLGGNQVIFGQLGE